VLHSSGNSLIFITVIIFCISHKIPTYKPIIQGLIRGNAFSCELNDAYSNRFIFKIFIIFRKMICFCPNVDKKPFFLISIFTIFITI